MGNYKPKLIVIVGPTACGKTSLSLELAQKYNGEIIAADSRTIYQDMNIGTAKPSLEERLKIPHYLIDVVQLDQEFTVAQFKQRALSIIYEILRRYKVPFLVGGTGLYISSIVNNLDIPCVPPDQKLRKKLEKKIIKHGLDYLWQKLIKLDPDAATFIQKQNPRRIIRALEVCLKTKKPFSQLRQKKECLFNVLQIGIKLNKKILIQRIDRRTEQMIKQGLVEEVKELMKKYPSEVLALNTIGYQEIISLLRGDITLNEAVDLIKKNTRQYARRQMTWFKKDKTIKWIENTEEAEKLVKDFLKQRY
ncbi:tRNA (adenosine(37)-N6)-dimethylallyltransferase MiaA [Patescibacteria group bacterium]|nr:tRNA (adenosine(37)-N6)-dimethylallyltransferase MiaA [Patescibacteria group bacterium]